MVENQLDETIVFNDTFRINLELTRVRDLPYSYR